MKNKERKKLIESLYTQIQSDKVMDYLTIIAGTICISLYVLSGGLWRTTTGATETLMGTLVGFYILLMGGTNFGILKNGKRTIDKAYSYDIYATVPMEKKELFDYDFPRWRIQAILVALGLSGMNLVYICNDAFQNATVFFIVLTLLCVSMEMLIFTYRYFYRKWAERMITVEIFLFVIIIVGNTAGICIPQIKRAETYIIEAVRFNPVLGIIMLSLSVLFVPVMEIVYRKFACRDKKSRAWYV